MKRNTFVNLFLCLMIVTFAFTGCGGGDDLSKYSKIVTFKGAIKAPRDFDCFSFFWESPTLDPDSELEYVIIRPNGKVFIQKTFTASGITAPGMRNRLDFDEELTGENPKVFLKSDVNFSFRAKKGILSLIRMVFIISNSSKGDLRGRRLL